jgi:hypothetical protein
MTHGHARPALADQRAAHATARAILTGADADAHQAAAEDGSCPACVAVAGISFGIALAATLAGDQPFVSERTTSAALAAVDAAERDLRAAGN